MATGCVPISGFVSLVGTSIGVANFAVTLKIYETTAGIEKNKLIIKKRKKKLIRQYCQEKRKTYNKLKSITFLIFRALIDSCISHSEFVSLDNILKEYDHIKETI